MMRLRGLLHLSWACDMIAMFCGTNMGKERRAAEELKLILSHEESTPERVALASLSC